MGPLVTYLQDKWAEVYFGFKEIIHIYQVTSEKADELFQSLYAEAVSSNNKFGIEDKQSCFVDSR